MTCKFVYIFLKDYCNSVFYHFVEIFKNSYCSICEYCVICHKVHVKVRLPPFNLFQPIVVFYVATNHLMCTANQMIGFYMKCNTGLN